MVRQLSLLVFIAIAFLATAQASPVVFGTPSTISADCGGCPSYSEPTPNLDAESGDLSALFTSSYYTSAWFYGPTTDYSAGVSFTLASDTLFDISATESYSADGTNCGDQYCPSPAPASWVLDGNFSGTISITGPTDVSFSFGESGSAPGTCDTSECTAQLQLSQTQSSEVDLSPGQYFLSISQSGGNYSVGDSTADLSAQVGMVDPSNVPEPRYFPLLFGFVGFVVWRFYRRSRRSVS